MPDLPRDRPHLYLRKNGRPEPYTSKTPPPRSPLPQRDRATHAQAVRSTLDAALTMAEAWRREREPDLAQGTPGFYLDFEIHPGAEMAADLLENRRKNIELVAVRQESETTNMVATVFVPDAAADHFLKKVEAYRAENTKTGKPKNEALISRIQTIALAAVRSVYTDDQTLFPAAGERIWWELWIRQGHVEAFDAVIHGLEIPASPQRLVFPDREVRLVLGDEITIARLFLNSDAIAELRRAKDTPALFVDWSNVEQAAWSSDLAARLVIPQNRDVVVCVLDTGVTQAHPLLSPALDVSDVHA